MVTKETDRTQQLNSHKKRRLPSVGELTSGWLISYQEYQDLAMSLIVPRVNNHHKAGISLDFTRVAYCHSLLSNSFATPWTIAHQIPLSVGFSRQEYCSGLPFPSPRDLPDPGIKPGSPSLQADALTSEPPGKPRSVVKYLQHFYLSVFKAKFRFSPYSKADSSLESPIFIPPAQCFSEV